jgi:ABC-type bacteriocin/lantibiotic exporter with double-glycine peptidase domain
LDHIGDIGLYNVSFTYPGSDHEVISDINLTIKKGERVAIIGTSGSGKTTLLKIIMGIVAPSKGEIRISRENIQKMEYRTDIAAGFIMLVCLS